MSEPSSLYMRVTLTQENLNALYASAAALPKHYDDWLAWLATKKFHGAITTADIQTMDAAELNTFGAYIQTLERAAWAGARAHYDATTRRWTFGVLQLSENYRDFVQALAILRAAAHFKNLPGDDFILIYPYIWGDPPGAYVEIAQASSRFVNVIPPPALAEANDGLYAVYTQITAGMDPANVRFLNAGEKYGAGKSMQGGRVTCRREKSVRVVRPLYHFVSSGRRILCDAATLHAHLHAARLGQNHRRRSDSMPAASRAF